MRSWRHVAHKSARKLLLALVASGLAVTTVAAAPASAFNPAKDPAGRATAAGPGKGVTTVTLITGDRVRLVKGPKGYTATATAARGREGVVFGTQRHGDSLWVLPSDTISLIADGRLDKRLFEVSELADSGYTDNKRTTIPLIVQHSKGKPVRTLPKGAAAGRELASTNATVLKQDKQTATGFWRWLTGATKSVPGQRFTARGAYAGDVRKVWLDAKVKASLDRSVPQVGAPAAWAKGYTGKGVKVAVLDTGIDTSHLDLKGVVTKSANFSESTTALDRFGHGTHVASIITGDGARSGGKYKGVAPDATLLNGKVLDDGGSGTESTVIAGMEWAVAQQAKVVNLSLGGGPTDGTDPIDQALNQLSTSSGALFVVSAGNDGPDRYTVSSPGAATEALTVGATNRNQTTADFSSAGPRLGDYVVKPEIAAPGRDIVAAKAAGTELGPPVGNYYVQLSGTSMAAPHVAGGAAILAQQQPTWNARVLKAALMGTTKLPVNESVFRQGAGFLDVSRAVTQKVFALEGSVSANMQWPHTQKGERTITYRNPGATPLTLNLAFQPKDQNGVAAAAGVFSLPSSVTVPPRTTAKVTLTIDPTKSTPGLLYQGRINATASGIVVRTPVSVNVERESYDLALTIIDRNGNPVTSFDQNQLLDIPYLVNLAGNGTWVDLRPKDGKFVARVPRGAYTIGLHVLTPSETGSPSTTLMSVPRLTSTAPVALTFDARQANRATATVAASGAKTEGIGTALTQLIGSEVWSTGVQVNDPAVEPEAYVAGTPAANRPYQFSLFQQLAASDRTYELALGTTGSLPADPTYPVADSDLADLAITVGAHNVKAVGTYLHDVMFGSGDLFVGFSGVFPVKQPAVRRHLVSASAFGTQAIWYSTLFADTTTGEWAYDEYGQEEGYAPGDQGTIKLSTAAFSPQGTGSHYEDGYMYLTFGPFNSSGGGFIYPYTDTLKGNWVLKRNGTQIATSDQPYDVFTEGATGTATYTAIMHASKQVAWSGYVPKVSGTWTFKSTAGSETPLPVISTKVHGDFDGWGRAPAGQAFPLTLDVAGADGGVASATVRVSYDDGTSWTTVPVSNASGQWVATVTHPATFTNPFVSVRVIVTDAKGNIGGWTATRAYKIANLG